MIFLVSLYWKLRGWLPVEEGLAHRLKRRTTFYTRAELWANSWIFLISKDIAILIMLFFLQQSSNVSLIALYFCGLTAVNILNAGYSKYNKFIGFQSDFMLF